MTENIQAKYIGGEYKVLQQFGGAMGHVFLVEKHDIPYPFVLKSYQATRPELENLFFTEVKNWVSFGVHQNIVKAIFAKKIDSKLFIAAEYVKGYDGEANRLTNFIGRDLPLHLLIKWVIQFTYGMNHCVGHGLKAHSDIKPDNILIDNDLNLKITDFGLSKSFLNEELAGGGTPLYYSPEQIFNPTEIDYRSDIYSFGILLYQLISKGSFPYVMSSRDIRKVHLTENIKPINHPLYQICKKCLEKNVTERYQQFRELFNDCVAVAKAHQIEFPRQNITRNDQLEELYLLSMSLSAVGENKQALEAINKYIEYQPEDSAAWTQKGRLEFEMGNLEDALESTKRSVYLFQYSSAALNNLGAIYLELDNPNDAKTCLLRAVEIAPDNNGALMNLANALAETNDIIESAQCIIRCFELTFAKKELIINARNLIPKYLNNRLFKNVIEIYNFIRKQEQLTENEIFNLAMCYYESRDFSKAIELFKIVLKKNPSDKETIINLSNAYGYCNDFENALRTSEILIDKNLDPIKGITMKGQYLQRLGKYSDAVSFMLREIMKYPTNDLLWVTFGLIHESENQNQSALKCFTTARHHMLKQGLNNNNQNVRFLDEKIRQLEDANK
ncbi:MAG: tetratricopeptide repeat protein [Bacteroidota bacterium]